MSSFGHVTDRVGPFEWPRLATSSLSLNIGQEQCVRVLVDGRVGDEAAVGEIGRYLATRERDVAVASQRLHFIVGEQVKAAFMLRRHTNR